MHGMPRPRRPSPDDDLDPRSFANLNRTFYGATPHDYFGRRLANLLLTAGRAPELDRLMDEGLSFRALKVGVQDGSRPRESTPEEGAKAAEDFVTAEAEVLFHHAAETLLRLYLAHEFAPGKPPACPWMHISRERSFSVFKARVAARFGSDTDPSDPEILAAVARVFYIVDDPTQLTTDPVVPMERWNASISNIEGYLRGFAHEFLKRAPLYNAAKHGLALRPGEGSVSYGGELIHAEGPMIQTLEIKERNGRPIWTMVNHWVEPDRQIVLTFQAVQLIERLWAAAQIRYLPKRPAQFHLRFFDGPSWLEIRYSGPDDAKGMIVETMSIGLQYFVAEDANTAEGPS
jgi:hypothetical protein